MQPRDYYRMKETKWAGIIKNKNPETRKIILETEIEISSLH
jgi:hypothetical protein